MAKPTRGRSRRSASVGVMRDVARSRLDYALPLLCFTAAAAIALAWQDGWASWRFWTAFFCLAVVSRGADALLWRRRLRAERAAGPGPLPLLTASVFQNAALSASVAVFAWASGTASSTV